jgi:hypothetical protein
MHRRVASLIEEGVDMDGEGERGEGGGRHQHTPRGRAGVAWVGVQWVGQTHDFKFLS